MPLPKLNLARFKEKLGPLPVWAWGLIIGVIAVLIYFVWVKKADGTAIDETVDDGGAAEAQANFDEADNAIQDAGADNIWDQIRQFIAGIIGPSAPPSVGNGVSTPGIGVAWGSGGGSGGYSGGAAIPASYQPPINLAGKLTSKTGQVFGSPSAGISGSGKTLGGIFNPTSLAFGFFPKTDTSIGKAVGGHVSPPNTIDIPSGSGMSVSILAPKIASVSAPPKAVASGPAPAKAKPAPAPAPAKAKAPVPVVHKAPVKTIAPPKKKVLR